MRFLPFITISLVASMLFPPAAFAGIQHGRLKVHEKTRTYRLYVPKSFDGKKKLPLVIVLHGGVGCGWSAEYDSRMSRFAERDKFICAYPNGWWRSWNSDECCGPARLKHIDDVAFIKAMIEQCKERYGVDADRVYVAGISNGGMLAYKLAMEIPNDIAAIAPVEGCMYPDAAAKASANPVSVIAIHGTADRIIRYDGGTGALFGYKVTAPSVADTIKQWVERDKCNPTPVHSENGDIVKDLYTGGLQGTEVCLYTVKNSGHVWPGGRRCIFVGDRPKQDWSATDAMCEFFWAHPKRPAIADSIGR